MSTYAPLSFINDVTTFFRDLKGYPSPRNEDVLHYMANSQFSREALYEHVLDSELGTVDTTKGKMILEKIRDDIADILLFDLRAVTTATILTYALMVDIRSLWRRNKLVYKIDEELGIRLMNTELPKEFMSDYLRKQPAQCYYIDTSAMPDVIWKDMHGFFVRIAQLDDIVMLYFISIKNDESPDIVTSSMYIDHTSEVCQSCSAVSTIGNDTELNNDLFYKLFINFCIYIQAANRDVEISERTRPNHTKEATVIKDKFREVKEFDVGLRYGNEIRLNRKRYKYVGEKSSAPQGKRSLTSHFRAAHWHRYWTGSGDNKELIVKWVEGVFVKGNVDTDAVTIHKVTGGR